MATDVELGPNEEVPCAADCDLQAAQQHLTALRPAGDGHQDAVWADVQVPGSRADHWHLHEWQNLGGARLHACRQVRHSLAVAMCRQVPSCGMLQAQSSAAAQAPWHRSTSTPARHLPDWGCRAGEGASTGLTEALVAKGFETSRLKTGTPARVDSRSVDFSGLAEQPGDETVRWFSYDPQVQGQT